MSNNIKMCFCKIGNMIVYAPLSYAQSNDLKILTNKESLIEYAEAYLLAHPSAVTALDCLIKKSIMMDVV